MAHRSNATLSLLAAAALALASCAFPTTGARGMAVGPHQLPTANAALAGAVRVNPVRGGRPNGALRPPQIVGSDVEQGLTDSLRSAGLLAPTAADARYAVDTELVQVDQPFLTEYAEVTSVIHYVLRDLRSGAPLLDRFIEVPYLARGRDAFRTNDRTQLANEGSVRESIETLLDALARLQVPADATPPAAAPAPADAAASPPQAFAQ